MHQYMISLVVLLLQMQCVCLQLCSARSASVPGSPGEPSSVTTPALSVDIRVLCGSECSWSSAGAPCTALLFTLPWSCRPGLQAAAGCARGAASTVGTPVSSSQVGMNVWVWELLSHWRCYGAEILIAVRGVYSIFFFTFHIIVLFLPFLCKQYLPFQLGSMDYLKSWKGK